MNFVRRGAGLAVAALVGCLWTASEAQAQNAIESPFSAQFDTALTVGNHDSWASGFELGWWMTDQFKLYIGTSWMHNVASGDLDDRADIIADAIGGTADMEQRATMVDFGARYSFKSVSIFGTPQIQPFVLGGGGFARTDTRPTFLVNGTDVTSNLEALGVRLGLDLDGPITKGVIVLGGGATIPISTKYFAEASLRYGYIFPRTSAIPNDTGTTTGPIQGSFGVRF